MAYADAKDFLFQTVLPACAKEIDNALLDTAGTVRNIQDVLDDADIPQTILTGTIASAAATRRLQQVGMLDPLLQMVAGAIAWVAQEIGSPWVSGGIADLPGAVFDLADQMDSDGDYIAGRGNTIASDPAAGDGLLLRRLTVDHRGFNIEGGIRETVTFEVTATPLTGAGPRVTSGVLYGINAADDVLDYKDTGTGRGVDIPLQVISDANPSSGLSNPSFVVSGNPSNGATVTEVTGWRLSDVAGTPTVVWRTTNPWRDNDGGVAVSGNSTTKRFEQDLVIPQGDGQAPTAYSPIDHMTVVYWDGTWSGTVTIGWGDTTQVFSSGAFSGAGFKYLVPDLDADLYGVNLSQSQSEFSIQIATTSGSGELVLQFADVQRMVARQGFYYSAWAQATDPVERLKKTWADSSTYTGVLQNTLQVLTGQAPWAYLPTSGSNLISPPAVAPEIGITVGGSNVADEGTIALGTVSASTEHDVTLRIANTGNGPLSIAVPVDNGSPTNATLTDTGISVPQAIMPGKYLDVTVGVTDGGAGAFSLTIRIDNNDADEGTYEITISGTAA
jgi:hypothetical protein